MNFVSDFPTWEYPISTPFCAEHEFHNQPCKQNHKKWGCESSNAGYSESQEELSSTTLVHSPGAGERKVDKTKDNEKDRKRNTEAQ